MTPVLSCVASTILSHASEPGKLGAPAGSGRNGERNFHGEKRRNDIHASTTDPDARLFRKGPGKDARLSFMGHALMENRKGLIVTP